MAETGTSLKNEAALADANRLTASRSRAMKSMAWPVSQTMAE